MHRHAGMFLAGIHGKGGDISDATYTPRRWILAFASMTINFNSFYLHPKGICRFARARLSCSLPTWT